jgi:hypothetical protein
LNGLSCSPFTVVRLLEVRELAKEPLLRPPNPVNESRKGPFRLFMVEGISCA